MDGKYMGSTPSTLCLPAGDHTISIQRRDFLPWRRTMAVYPGGNVTIDAALESALKRLRFDEILNLLGAGVPNTRLIDLVQQRGVEFQLDDQRERQLREAGAQDALLGVIRSAPQP